MLNLLELQRVFPVTHSPIICNRPIIMVTNINLFRIQSSVFMTIMKYLTYVLSYIHILYIIQI